jgi:hypothetical protein
MNLPDYILGLGWVVAVAIAILFQRQYRKANLSTWLLRETFDQYKEWMSIHDYNRLRAYLDVERDPGR